METSTEFQDQGPKKGIVILVIIILLGTNGLLLWQFFDKKSSYEQITKNLETASHEKDQLLAELNAIRLEREKLLSDNVQYKDQLSQQDSSLKIKEEQIQHLLSIGGPTQLAKAKAEMAKLKEMNELYALQVDSLNTVNIKLTADVQYLHSNLAEQENKNTVLTKEVSKLSDKVAMGSILSASNIVTEAVKIKSNGNETPTNKAKQVMKIHTKFTIAQNRVVDAGPIDIYVRIVGPDGNVMSSSNQSFIAGNETIVYTTRQTVDYQNRDTEVDVIWAKGTQFTKGTYNVELYQGGRVIGKSSIELK